MPKAEIMLSFICFKILKCGGGEYKSKEWL